MVVPYLRLDILVAPSRPATVSCTLDRVSQPAGRGGRRNDATGLISHEAVGPLGLSAGPRMEGHALRHHPRVSLLWERPAESPSQFGPRVYARLPLRP
ncbi:hypothetical protein VTO73DRAFT_10749 [Trametes versicolor]